MIVIQDTIISEELFDTKFTCHLEKCKGACCVEGDRGAPLAPQDIEEITNNIEAIKPYMTPAYLKTMEQEGFYEIDDDGEPVTTCQPTGECNFVVYDNTGTTQCAIELAHKAGAIDYKKPISCHLYPVRLQKYKHYTAVNYSQWDICSPACTLGQELNMPVYAFLKDALIRKFGADWYNELVSHAPPL
jgi:hypothetical protein